MPNFNRRGFLQLLGAAGVAPLLPALPTRAMATTAGGSISKALWAGIYAKSGSVPKFAGVAQSMGLSNAAIQGVSARSVGVRVVLAAATNPIARTAVTGKATMRANASSQSEPWNAARNILRDVERATSTKANTTKIANQDADTRDPISAANKPQNDAP